MKKFTVLISGLILAAGIAVVTPTSAKAYEKDGYYYEVDDKEAIIVGTSYELRKNKELHIPSTLDGFKVTEIGANAFSYSSAFEKITIPDTVEELGYAIFSHNTKLKTVTLPKKLERLPERTFSGCSELTTVNLGTKLEEIGVDAFNNCISLKKIKLPKTVKKIHEYAFYHCYKLEEVNFGPNLMKIGTRAFYANYKLKKLTFPKKLNKIEDEAFAKCEDLTAVTFSNPKTKLGKKIFRKCTSMVKASLPADAKQIPEGTFYECSKLEKVKFPKSVSIIKRKAFMGCTSLKKIKLNKNIYAIGDKAFAESGLNKIQLNKKLQFVGNAAFCNTNLKNLTFGNKVTYIGNRLFADCRKLKTISIPASVKGINPGAFNNCVSLRAINVSGANKYYSSQSGVLYNKNKTKLIQYPLHKASASFTTPGTLKKIRAYAFAENSYLKSVVITAGKIGNGAFARMKKLRSVMIQNGAVRIGEFAFAQNPKLKKVVLPDSVANIGRGAFMGTKIRNVHIPASLTKMGSDAFANCYNLAAFDGGNSRAYTVKDGVLYNGDKTTLIKYPSKKTDKVFAVPNSVKKVRREAFDHTVNLIRLEFGTRLEKMRYHAIYKAKKLKSILFKTKRLSFSSSYGSVEECERLAVIVGPNRDVMRYLARGANATLITL